MYRYFIGLLVNSGKNWKVPTFIYLCIAWYKPIRYLQQFTFNTCTCFKSFPSSIIFLDENEDLLFCLSMIFYPHTHKFVCSCIYVYRYGTYKLKFHILDNLWNKYKMTFGAWQHGNKVKFCNQYKWHRHSYTCIYGFPSEDHSLGVDCASVNQISYLLLWLYEFVEV